MRQISLIKILGLSLLIGVFSSCEEVDHLPDPEFRANIYGYTSDHKEVTVSFTDLSSIDAEEWIWHFEGGTPSVSYERDPIVSYSSAGTFDVTLTVRNGNGTRELTKYNYVNVGDFYNPTWADIYVTYQSDNIVAPIDDYILLANVGNTVISYYAETSGLTAENEQVGLLIYWDESVNLLESEAWDFIIEDIFVFINVQNYGPDDFYPFTVNYGDPDYELTDYITIANDGVWKSTGYYDAWDFMEVRAYFKNDPNTYVEWIEDYHFDLLWVVNQGVDLWYDGSKNTLKSKAKAKTTRDIDSKPLISSGSKRK